jgi:AraC-like DNA-binding protein
VAEQVGYRSEWAFRHAFVRQFGQTPLRYGKAMR